jgi:hypothetical protein
MALGSIVESEYHTLSTRSTLAHASTDIVSRLCRQCVANHTKRPAALTRQREMQFGQRPTHGLLANKVKASNGRILKPEYRHTFRFSHRYKEKSFVRIALHVSHPVLGEPKGSSTDPADDEAVASPAFEAIPFVDNTLIGNAAFPREIGVSASALPERSGTFDAARDPSPSYARSVGALPPTCVTQMCRLHPTSGLLLSRRLVRHKQNQSG